MYVFVELKEAEDDVLGLKDKISELYPELKWSVPANSVGIKCSGVMGDEKKKVKFDKVEIGAEVVFEVKGLGFRVSLKTTFL